MPRLRLAAEEEARRAKRVVAVLLDRQARLGEQPEQQAPRAIRVLREQPEQRVQRVSARLAGPERRAVPGPLVPQEP